MFAVSVGTHRAPSNTRVVCSTSVLASSSVVFRAAARGGFDELGDARVPGSIQALVWCEARAALGNSEAGALAVVPWVRGSLD